MTASSPRFLAAIAVIAMGSPVVFASDLQVDLEWVRASQGRNVVQVPNDANGTRFSLDALTGSGTANAPRLQLSWRSGEKQEWRLLAAPLSLSVSVRFRSTSKGSVSRRAPSRLATNSTPGERLGGIDGSIVMI
jgi:hypothetical protein